MDLDLANGLLALAAAVVGGGIGLLGGITLQRAWADARFQQLAGCISQHRETDRRLDEIVARQTRVEAKVDLLTDGMARLQEAFENMDRTIERLLARG